MFDSKSKYCSVLTVSCPQISPTQFLETINAINERLLAAHSLSHAFVDNALAFFSLQITRAIKKTHYEKVHFPLPRPSVPRRDTSHWLCVHCADACDERRCRRWTSCGTSPAR